jgi:hypothetical protein
MIGLVVTKPKKICQIFYFINTPCTVYTQMVIS